jgi:hypothetical protein
LRYASTFLATGGFIVLLFVGVALGGDRLTFTQWLLQQVRGQMPLLTLELTGVQWDFDRIGLSKANFELQLGAWQLSAQLKEVAFDYGVHVPKEVSIADTKLKFAYHPAVKPLVNTKAGMATMAKLTYPFDRLSIKNVDVEGDTPWGAVRFTGRAEIKRGLADRLEASFQDGSQAIRIELEPDFRTLRIAMKTLAGGNVFQLNAGHLNQSKQQASIHATIGPLVDWLSKSQVVPKDWQEMLMANPAISLASGLTPVTLAIDMQTSNYFEGFQGRALLTRDNRYLASAEASMVASGMVSISGHLDMAATEARELVQPWLPKSTRAWLLASGKVQGMTTLSWQSRQGFSGTVHLNAFDLVLTAGPVRIGQGNVTIDIADVGSGFVALSANAPTLDVGKVLAARNLMVNAHYLHSDVTIEHGGLSLFGGLLEMVPGTVNIHQQPVLLTLRVSDVDISQLLAVIDYKDLTASGTVSGELPLKISQDAIELLDGTLTGTGPGVVRYQGQVSDNENIAFKALRNLAYRRLQAKINYRPNGDYGLGLRLEGHNPEVLSGHPLAFNVNINGQLPALLQQGIQTGDFEKVILEQVNTRPGNASKPPATTVP